MTMPMTILVPALTALTLLAGSAGAAEAPPAGASSKIETFTEGPLKLTVWQIPNIPEAAEAYYGPDNLHVIAQVQDPKALRAKGGASGGALTWTFTDQGTDIRHINDHGQDACSYFMPDGKHLVWTSTRDHMDWPVGNWSDPKDYPTGGELYKSDLNGKHIQRLTNNNVYDAEVSVSPDGKWIVFGRKTDGNMDLWRMRSDGTGEQRITFTPDWEEGRPMYLPDSETVMFRAWKYEDLGKRPTPMTVFTIKHDGTGLTARTRPDTGMNWGSYPAPDGRHFIAVRVIGNNNWELFLFDMENPDAEPVQLTYHEGFDGFGSFSPDCKKMLFTRSVGTKFMKDLYTFVMDVSPLNLGPKPKK